MNVLHCAPDAYVEGLQLHELQAELVLAASRLVGTRVVISGLNEEFYVCRECAGRARERNDVKHLPECQTGFVAYLLLAIAHREAEQASPTHSAVRDRKEPSDQTRKNRSCEQAGAASPGARPFLLPGGAVTAFGEPWAKDPDGVVHDCAGNAIVDPVGCELVEPDDARALARIVDCVNFCEGIPSADLRRIARQVECAR